VKSIDVTGGVVDGVVELDGVGAAIGQREEGVPVRVSEGGAESAKRVRRRAILQVVFQAREISEGPSARVIESSYGEKRQSLGLRMRCDEESKNRSDQSETGGSIFHGRIFLLGVFLLTGA
jgi:hypothetical protein